MKKNLLIGKDKAEKENLATLEKEVLKNKTKDADIKSSMQSYGIEASLDKEKKEACRQIVREINNFGVSQRQKLFIIELLSFELENRDSMLILTEACKEARTRLDSGIITTDEKPKLITK